MSEERLEIATPGFSTADAEQVRLQFDGGGLTLDFVDWRERPVRVVFREAIGFRWNAEVKWEEGARDDVTYVVHESDWLQSQARLGGGDPAAFQHLRLCFNACGVLDVLCKSFSSDIAQAGL